MTDKGVVAETATSGWISIKDRMPEEGVHVLVWVVDGYCLFDWIYHGTWSVAGNSFIKKYTHWMPLPEPPKEEA